MKFYYLIVALLLGANLLEGQHIPSYSPPAIDFPHHNQNPYYFGQQQKTSKSLKLLLSLKGYAPGYIIKNNQDTISGLINHTYTDGDRHLCIKFLLDGEKKEYSPRNLKGCTWNAKNYKTYKHDKISNLMEQEVEGELTLMSYHRIVPVESNSVLDFEAKDELMMYVGKQYLLRTKNSEEFYEIDKYNFDELINDLFAGYDTITTYLSNKKRSIKDLPEIVELCNQQITDAPAPPADFFQEGYLITKRMDTIVGKLGFDPTQNNMQVVFKATENSKPAIYFPHELYGFYSAKTDLILSDKVESIQRFLKRETKGKYMSLYAIPSSQTEGKSVFYLKLEPKGVSWYIDERNFKSEAKYDFSGYRPILKKLNSGELRYDNLPALVELYNQLKAEKIADKQSGENGRKE